MYVLTMNVTLSKPFIELIDIKVSLDALCVAVMLTHSVCFQTMDISGHAISVVE